MTKIFSAVMALVVLVGGTISAAQAGEPTLHSDTVAALSTDTYTMTFGGRVQAAVAVVGGAGADLGLLVYDDNGNLIGADRGNQCVVTFTPRRTGRFIIKVINLDPVPNNYVLGVK